MFVGKGARRVCCVDGVGRSEKMFVSLDLDCFTVLCFLRLWKFPVKMGLLTIVFVIVGMCG